MQRSGVVLFAVALVLGWLLAGQIPSIPAHAQGQSSNAVFSLVAATGQSGGSYYPVVFRLNLLTGAVSVCSQENCKLLRDGSVP